MKFTKLLLITFFLLSNLSFSQTKEKDSLLVVLDMYTKKDSVRVLKLFDVINYYYKKDISKTKIYIEEALSISKEINSKRLEIQALRKLSRFYLKKGFKDQALEKGLLSKNIADSIGLKEEQLFSNSLLLTIYGTSGYFKKALNIGLHNLKIAKQDPNNNNLDKYYVDLARVYRALEDYDKAEEFYLKALDLAKGNESKRISLYMSLSELYKRDAKFGKAKKYLNRALSYYSKNNQETSVAKATYILATIYSMEGNHEKATKFYNKSLDHFIKTKNLYYQKLISQNLYINYSILEKKEEATTINTLYNAVKDSIESKERKKLVAQMKTKYETDKVISEKKIIELKNKQNKTYFIISLLAGFLLLTLSVFYINRLKIKKKSELVSLELKQTKKRLELEKQYRNSELKALKSQMNPHFMFNAMNSIQSLILKGKKEDAYNYLTKFSTLIRENLNMSEKNFVYFDEELNLIKTYLELEKLRFTTDFTYELNGLDVIDDIKIPSMIIQPFIENSIKHGLLHKNGEKTLKIDFKQEEVLKCIIYDNGIGRKKSEDINKRKVGKYASFSSGAIAKRFLLLKEYYKLDLGFAYEDLVDENGIAKGTRVTIKIPYILDDE